MMHQSDFSNEIQLVNIVIRLCRVKKIKSCFRPLISQYLRNCHLKFLSSSRESLRHRLSRRSFHKSFVRLLAVSQPQNRWSISIAFQFYQAVVPVHFQNPYQYKNHGSNMGGRDGWSNFFQIICGINTWLQQDPLVQCSIINWLNNKPLGIRPLFRW